MNDPLVIDLAHWRLDDKVFQEERKSKWPMIENMLNFEYKSKKAINIIKKYYLKGELPDWQKIDKENEIDTHNTFLDIAIFLWLHPSSDFEVLMPLKVAYYQGFDRSFHDVIAGMQFVYEWCVCSPAFNGKIRHKPTVVAFEGKGKLLFDVIFSNLNDGYLEFGQPPYKQLNRWPGLSTLDYIGDWLGIKKLNMHSNDMLLQHSEPLELTFQNINRYPTSTARELEWRKIVYEKCLYRIAFFDTEKEGDSPRTICVNKVRKILDDGENVTELTQMWNKIKNGEIIVKDPWKR